MLQSLVSSSTTRPGDDVVPAVVALCIAVAVDVSPRLEGGDTAAASGQVGCAGGPIARVMSGDVSE